MSKDLPGYRDGGCLSPCLLCRQLGSFWRSLRDTGSSYDAYVGEFCTWSSESINKAKSRIIFSKNVQPGCCLHLSQSCHIPLATEFGTFLGVPIVQGKVSSNIFSY